MLEPIVDIHAEPSSAYEPKPPIKMPAETAAGYVRRFSLSRPGASK
jgi:hypothetical protein